jgi:hypothetical protein
MTDFSTVDIVMSTPGPRMVWYANAAGRAVLISEGFVPDAKVWSAVPELPGWLCTQSPCEDADIARVRGRERAHEVAKLCDLHVGFLNGDTLEEITA